MRYIRSPYTFNSLSTTHLIVIIIYFVCITFDDGNNFDIIFLYLVCPKHIHIFIMNGSVVNVARLNCFEPPRSGFTRVQFPVKVKL